MHKDERKALLDANAPFYQEMGHLISDWAMLEHQVNETVWELAQTYPALGACITSQIFSINNRLMGLIALMTVRKVDPKLIAQVRRFSDEIRGPAEKRNRVENCALHAHYVLGLNASRRRIPAHA